MSFLTAEIDDTSRSVLESQALESGISIERFAGEILARHALDVVRKPVPMSNDIFRAALEQTMREKAELYRRLAQ